MKQMTAIQIIEMHNSMHYTKERRVEEFKIEREKQRIRAATRRAIARGELVKQPCEKCGDINVHAHHDDYNQTTKVRWLCPLHHRQWHAQGGTPVPFRGN